MVFIEPFAVERWIDEHETWAKYNFSETASAPVSLSDLITLSPSEPNTGTSIISSTRKLGYGAIPGSEALRRNIVDNLYDASISPDNVLITPGAIAANFLVLLSLVGPGDHVICHYPTYQQLYSIPESLGAEVSLWKAKEKDGWNVDLDELRKLVRKNTKLIIINTPQNPTGHVLPLSTLKSLVKLASTHKPNPIYLFGDEVYRPLFHSLASVPSSQPHTSSTLSSSPSEVPSLLTLSYPYSIVTGSMSKAFSLPGIRVGWIATPSSKTMSTFTANRDYMTISVSQVDDQIATFALSRPVVNNLLERNTKLAVSNLALVTDTLRSCAKGLAHWTTPTAATMLFVRFTSCRAGEEGKPVDDEVFCQRVQERKGLLLVPGRKCFGNDHDFAGYVRIGYVCDRDELVGGLEVLREFMADRDPKGEGFGGVPLAKKDEEEDGQSEISDLVEVEKEEAKMQVAQVAKTKRLGSRILDCFGVSSE